MTQPRRGYVSESEIRLMENHISRMARDRLGIDAGCLITYYPPDPKFLLRVYKRDPFGSVILFSETYENYTTLKEKFYSEEVERILFHLQFQ